MAIAIDLADIGGAVHQSASSSTVAFTTGSTVAANGFIVLSVGWENNGATLSSVAGGGLSWVVDKQGKRSGSGAPNSALVSAQAPSGLASGTTITATFSVAVIERCIGGTSFTGVATSSPVDTTSGPVDFSATTAWTTPSTAILAGSVLIGAAYEDNGVTGSTITAPSVEMIDVGTAGFVRLTSGYRIEASAGSYTVAGTWASNTSGVTNGVAYLAAAAVGPTPAASDNPPIGILGRGAGW